MAPRITRREFIGTAAAATAAVGAGGFGADAAAKRPNVLFILADDLGYGDLSCYGRPGLPDAGARCVREAGDQVHEQRTPPPGVHADALRVHHGPLSAAPGGRTGRAAASRRSPADVGLPPDHPTIASLLKGNGYETSLVGKWHLGWKPEFGPNRHGFDEFFGILSGAADYFTHRASDASGGAGRGRLRPISGRT